MTCQLGVKSPELFILETMLPSITEFSWFLKKYISESSLVPEYKMFLIQIETGRNQIICDF